MSFFDEMKSKYAPTMSRVEFSNLLNRIENEFFDAHPEYLDLCTLENLSELEAKQNAAIDEFMRKHYACHH